MAEKSTQTYANHARFHPLFHYFLAPGAIVLIVLTAVNVVRHYSGGDAWILLLMAILFFAALFPVAVVSPPGAGPHHPAGGTPAFGANTRRRIRATQSGSLTEPQLIAIRALRPTGELLRGLSREYLHDEDVSARHQEEHRDVARR